MHFSNIELYNYGIYKGLHNIALQDRQGKKNITLVGGMNGRGKTTLLDSVFLCLYGRKSVEFITGKKSAYSNVLKDRINKSSTDKRTYIKLTMKMDDEEGTEICITRSWEQTVRKVEDSLTVVKNGIEDSYLSKNWEFYVEELIPFGIARFFFFDNEKISQIADDEAFDKIKDSIKSVMGVTTMAALCANIEKIRKEKSSETKKSDNASLTKEADETETAIERNDTKTRGLYSQRAALIPELERAKDQLEKTEQEFWKKGGNLSFNRDAIIRNQHELKEKSLNHKSYGIAGYGHSPSCWHQTT